MNIFMLYFFNRTKWKRQTQVGLELLAEAGNYAAVQRMLQTHPYWGAYMNHAVRPLEPPPPFLGYGAPPVRPQPGPGVFMPGLLPSFPPPPPPNTSQ